MSPICVRCNHLSLFFFFFNDTATTEIYTLSLHDALPISDQPGEPLAAARPGENAELHLREAELGPGVIGGDAVAAGESELEPAAEARTVDPDRDRLGEAGHTPQHLLPLGREPLGFRGGGEPDELLDVGPPDEVFW